MKKSNQNRDVANALVLVLQFSLNIIVPILFCTFVGKFLADRFENKYIIIWGIIIGIIAGINGAYRQVKHFLKDEESPGQRARRLEEENRDDKVDKKT